MTTYKLIKTSAGEIQSIVRDDNACIPVCEGNRDFQQYLADVAAGVTVTEDIIPDISAAGPTIEDRIDALEGAFLDDLLTRL